jgi:hypothetical protein
VLVFFQYFAFFELNNGFVKIPLIFRIFRIFLGFVGFFEKLKKSSDTCFAICHLTNDWEFLDNFWNFFRIFRIFW